MQHTDHAIPNCTHDREPAEFLRFSRIADEKFVGAVGISNCLVDEQLVVCFVRHDGCKEVSALDSTSTSPSLMGTEGCASVPRDKGEIREMRFFSAITQMLAIMTGQRERRIIDLHHRSSAPHVLLRCKMTLNMTLRGHDEKVPRR